MSPSDQELLAALHAIDVRLARIEERSMNLERLDERLTTLERWRERLLGISMAIGAVSSVLTGLLLWGLGKLFQ